MSTLGSDVGEAMLQSQAQHQLRRSDCEHYFLLTASNSQFPYPQANTKSIATRGMITGSKIKILGTSSYLYTMTIYDDKGRVIQTRSTNITGGTDIATMQYTWAGLPLIVVHKQQYAGSNAQSMVTVTRYHYDAISGL